MELLRAARRGVKCQPFDLRKKKKKRKILAIKTERPNKHECLAIHHQQAAQRIYTNCTAHLKRKRTNPGFLGAK
ncbi:hypothetical protein OUZ56_029103 [Daphnia magna]|uniref:Uncharacterized protein n=1 Tax=Daphnia magna TaxID=35525 RepID=A0ABR0B5U7_9CRUS|nr:hypothetical protein OUZ56_029103 [Daphnia magna]